VPTAHRRATSLGKYSGCTVDRRFAEAHADAQRLDEDEKQRGADVEASEPSGADSIIDASSITRNA